MGSAFDDESVRQIAALPNLETLILEETSVTDAGVAAAAALPKLRALELAGSVFSKNRVTGATLAGFAGKPLENLEILVPLSSEGWAAVARLTQLKRLKAPSDKCPSDETFASLAGLTQLEELVLNHGDLTDACADTLAKFTQLKILWLSSNDEFSDAGLAKLRGLTQLETLALDGTQISDASLPILKSFAALKTFHGDGTKMTEAALKEFQAGLKK
jgi:Leucine-rich repeat (LRR) protein